MANEALTEAVAANQWFIVRTPNGRMKDGKTTKYYISVQRNGAGVEYDETSIPSEVTTWGAHNQRITRVDKSYIMGIFDNKDQAIQVAKSIIDANDNFFSDLNESLDESKEDDYKRIKFLKDELGYFAYSAARNPLSDNEKELKKKYEVELKRLGDKYDLDVHWWVRDNLDEAKNDTLNPAIWENDELKPEVKETLEKIANTFLEKLKADDIPLDVDDIIIVGSNRNYNYGPQSDIDLHIIRDLSEFKGREKELAEKLYQRKKSIFNDKYSPTINGFEVEIYVEPADDKDNNDIPDEVEESEEQLTEAVKNVVDFSFDIQKDETWVEIELDDGEKLRGTVNIKFKNPSDHFGTLTTWKWDDVEQATKQLLSQKYGYNIPYKQILSNDEVNNSTITFSSVTESIDEKLVKKGSKWQAQSEKGRNFGTYDTKAEAEERLKQMEMFKHMNEAYKNTNEVTVEELRDLPIGSFIKLKVADYKDELNAGETAYVKVDDDIFAVTDETGDVDDSFNEQTAVDVYYNLLNLEPGEYAIATPGAANESLNEETFFEKPHSISKGIQILDSIADELGIKVNYNTNNGKVIAYFREPFNGNIEGYEMAQEISDRLPDDRFTITGWEGDGLRVVFDQDFDESLNEDHLEPLDDEPTFEEFLMNEYGMTQDEVEVEPEVEEYYRSQYDHFLDHLYDLSPAAYDKYSDEEVEFDDLEPEYTEFDNFRDTFGVERDMPDEEVREKILAKHKEWDFDDAEEATDAVMALWDAMKDVKEDSEEEVTEALNEENIRPELRGVKPHKTKDGYELDPRSVEIITNIIYSEMDEAEFDELNDIAIDAYEGDPDAKESVDELFAKYGLPDWALMVFVENWDEDNPEHLAGLYK